MSAENHCGALSDVWPLTFHLLQRLRKTLSRDELYWRFELHSNTHGAIYAIGHRVVLNDFSLGTA